jgi:putative FmdB family regulatory protein
MPFYQVQCKKCNEEYDVYSTIGDMDKNIKKAKCERCGSKRKSRIISGVSFSFANPEGTDLWSRSHDYRFKTKLPKATAEREAAQKASHMGEHPYNKIDDISSGKHFGEVK